MSDGLPDKAVANALSPSVAPGSTKKHIESDEFWFQSRYFFNHRRKLRPCNRIAPGLRNSGIVNRDDPDHIRSGFRSADDRSQISKRSFDAFEEPDICSHVHESEAGSPDAGQYQRDER
ncbi:MAG: hypothetical protein O7C59_05435 [Rickettsia endosymbiont of Ixodes persulcatus]|nr:hypothetical protein [Rickettsia endosymbiont of Ixodes persulcatus]